MSDYDLKIQVTLASKHVPRNSSAGWFSTSSRGAVHTAEKSGLHMSCMNTRQRVSSPVTFAISPRGVMSSAHCAHDSSLQFFPRNHGEARNRNRMKMNAMPAIDNTNENAKVSHAHARRRDQRGSEA